jgi:hypothetical protein
MKSALLPCFYLIMRDRNRAETADFIGFQQSETIAMVSVLARFHEKAKPSETAMKPR